MKFLWGNYESKWVSFEDDPEDDNHGLFPGDDEQGRGIFGAQLCGESLMKSSRTFKFFKIINSESSLRCIAPKTSHSFTGASRLYRVEQISKTCGILIFHMAHTIHTPIKGKVLFYWIFSWNLIYYLEFGVCAVTAKTAMKTKTKPRANPRNPGLKY